MLATTDQPICEPIMDQNSKLPIEKTRRNKVDEPVKVVVDLINQSNRK